jgi:hypothetical protein
MLVMQLNPSQHYSHYSHYVHTHLYIIHRERMSNIQIALSQTRWSATSAVGNVGTAGLSGSDLAPTQGVGQDPPFSTLSGLAPQTLSSHDASGTGSNLEAIQRRIRDLSRGGGESG